MDPLQMRKVAMRSIAGATAVAASLSLVACGGGEQASVISTVK